MYLSQHCAGVVALRYCGNRHFV